jgi:excisionase family DNA binding protein
MTDRLLYTRQEAAERLTTTANWLKVAARRRDIPCHRLGGQRRILFSEEDIQEIMESMAERPIFEIQPRRRF